MVFNSIHFAVFFAIIWCLTLALRNRLLPRNLLLLVASYYFYGWWDWRFLSLLMASTAMDYTVARLLGEKSPDVARTRRDRLILCGSVFLNLGILGFFKYYGFFVDSTADLLSGLGFHPNLPTLYIILPVGISFYTFQTLGYTIDVYRGDIAPERSLLKFALYVSFFPQLVAGPIERASNLLPQFSKPTRVDFPMISSGAYLIFSGLFKKVVLADNAAKVVQFVFDQRAPEGWSIVLAAYAFCIQIYCDFSGYSDIARGCARWMGFELMQNFNQPYFATNPSDFWARWHISLSTWIRDYLYIPLGGNRKGPIRTYVNLMVVMTLCGLWHGAAWTYVAWGVFHGTILCIHRAVGPWMDRNLTPRAAIGAASWRVIRIVGFFQVTALGFLLFRSETLGQFGGMVASLVTNWNPRLLPVDRNNLYIVLACAVVLLAVQLAKELKKDAYIVLRLPAPARAVIYAAGIVVFLAFGEFYGEPFIYFQF